MDIHPMANGMPPMDSASARVVSMVDSVLNVSGVASVSGTQTVSAAKPVQATPTTGQVSQALENINKTLQSLAVGVEFSQDSDTHQTIIKVVDKQTQDVIRQIPSETMLEIAKALDKVQGILFDAKA